MPAHDDTSQRRAGNRGCASPAAVSGLVATGNYDATAVQVACCRRRAATNTLKPVAVRPCSLIRPRVLSSPTIPSGSLRREPPPKSLINSRCSGRVNSSQICKSLMPSPRLSARQSKSDSSALNEAVHDVEQIRVLRVRSLFSNTAEHDRRKPHLLELGRRGGHILF